jgi:hypothetical protein
MRFRILVPAILTIALSTVVAPAHAATPVRTVSDAMALAASPAGLYNLTLVGARGEQAVDLALEQVKDGFSALLITPTHESWLSNVKFDGKRLTGSTLTSAGRGTLTLEVTDSGVRGSLVVAGQSIAISGTRER